MILRLFLASIACFSIAAFPAVGDAKANKKKRAKRKARTHVVQSGQTLWEISRAHGCTVSAVTGANHLTSSQILKIGQKLRIPRCTGKAKRRASTRAPAMYHFVIKGDTLSRIAKTYDTTISAIRATNKISGNMIRPGDRLRILPGKGGKGRPIPGQSVGVPHHGKLIRAAQLPRGRGYYRRRPWRAWGANQTIYHVRRAVRIIRSQHKGLHTLAIGDISAKKGGHLPPHVSHQSGRDIDIGFYFKHKPKGYPTAFQKLNRRNANMAANWTMLRTFAATANQPGGVLRIYLDYKLQKMFYKWALKRKVSKTTLSRLFQYPHGIGSAHGLIHHEPGHDDHIHVRFKCPEHDRKCSKK